MMLSWCFVDVFNIYICEVGVGELSVVVEGFFDVFIKFEERFYGFFGVSYKVKVVGKVFF